MKRAFPGRRARLLDLLFPPKCVNCGEPIGERRQSRIFCPVCRQKFLSEITRPCPVCGREYSRCLCKPVGFLPDAFAYSLPYDKEDGVARKLLLCCKSQRLTDAFREVASIMLATAKERGLLPDGGLITYVPRAPEKAEKKGVDQAQELAEELSRLSGLPCVGLIAHKRFSLDQKLLGGAQRGRNAEGSFRLTHAAGSAAGRTILLIDDIVTTGSTVNACTRLLREAGAERVICLSAAKNVKTPLFHPKEEPPS